MRQSFITTLIMLTLLAGCNTVAGVGEDVEAGGRAITDTSEEAQEEISN